MKPIEQLIGVAYGNDIKLYMEKNISSNIRSMYYAISTIRGGKYHQLLCDVVQHYPVIDDQIQYLTKHAPGKTLLKSLVSQYYTRHNKVDLRITHAIIKNFLRFQKIRYSIIEELNGKSYYYKAYYGDEHLLYPSIVRQISNNNVQDLVAYYMQYYNSYI